MRAAIRPPRNAGRGESHQVYSFIETWCCAVTISVLNPTGGMGKTTIPTTLTGALQERGYFVLLVDADRQGSAVQWLHKRSLYGLPGRMECVQITEATLERDLSDTRADFVIINGSARLEKLYVSAIKAGDVVLIPVLDLWAVEGTIELIRTHQQANRGRPRAAFIAPDYS